MHMEYIIKLEEEVWSESMDKRKYVTHQGWVLLEDKKIIGVCIYKKIEYNIFYLSTIIVEKIHAGKGYGRMLLDLLVDMADKERIILMLKAYKGLDYLIKLYESYNFEYQIGSESKSGSPIMIRYVS